MDDPGLPLSQLRPALRFLAWIHDVSGAGRLLAREVPPGRVLDVACGDAHALRGLVRAGRARDAVGIDRSGGTLAVAATRRPAVRLVRGEASRLPFGGEVFDAAYCHLFLHHLDDAEAVRVLAEMARVARRVVVVDLGRRRRLHILVRLLTTLVPNRLVRHDGPASVRQAYTAEEALALARRLGLPARVRRERWDRWCLVVEKR
jgi:ubiquinone/menaquinone biosynthesis C-methylase UbiE